jgi:putative zinc finger protein
VNVWHLEPELVRRYVGGTVDPESAASAEAHLMACAACRTLLVPHVDTGRTAAIWAEVVDRVDAPRPSLLERALVRLGVGEATARLVAATPTLRGPWLAAIAGVLTFAALAAQSDERWLRAFLVVAPLVPLGGVAVAFASGLDPTREIGLATPYPGLRLLLIRTAAVLAVTVPAALAAGLALPGPSWLAAAWLLPATGLTSAALALTGWLRPVVAIGAVALGWAGATVPATLQGQAGALFGAGAQLGWLALATGGVVWLVAGRNMLMIRLGRSS